MSLFGRKKDEAERSDSKTPTVKKDAPRTMGDLLDRKVAILAVGAKGIVSFKGLLVNIDGDFIVLEVEKTGLLAGKQKQVTFFSKNAILGIRPEE